MDNPLLILLPLFLGIVSVLQAGLNEKIFGTLGISATLVLNSLTLALLSLILWFLAAHFPQFLPKSLDSPTDHVAFRWWYFIPGILGYLLVMGIPLSISHIGASRTMLYLIVMQLLTGVAWDWYTKGSTLSGSQTAGIVLAIIAAICMSI